MRSRAQVVLVVLTVTLLPWLGLLQALPHSHTDTEIPQEALACSASAPGSHEVHLHGAGQSLAPHPCLACLAGTSHAAAPSPAKLAGAESVTSLTAARADDVRSRSRAHLPLLRGPPVVA
ncbi:MAG: hypothetical protein QNL88_06045 [Acidobacteriota bacterium]|nr:hypothetical protein [Acidobacteriota bacterium]